MSDVPSPPNYAAILKSSKSNDTLPLNSKRSGPPPTFLVDYGSSEIHCFSFNVDQHLDHYSHNTSPS
ncbi:hypothetical protein BVRB_3g069850 [Beta vulgaris subsp. vulgaris]|nr:hypothetical protein BVRB_3g069850 [Beta vulgaris subsp. vulgaris]